MYSLLSCSDHVPVVPPADEEEEEEEGEEEEGGGRESESSQPFPSPSPPPQSDPPSPDAAISSAGFPTAPSPSSCGPSTIPSTHLDSQPSRDSPPTDLGTSQSTNHGGLDVSAHPQKPHPQSDSTAYKPPSLSVSSDQFSENLDRVSPNNDLSSSPHPETTPPGSEKEEEEEEAPTRLLRSAVRRVRVSPSGEGEGLVVSLSLDLVRSGRVHQDESEVKGELIK